MGNREPVLVGRPMAGKKRPAKTPEARAKAAARKTEFGTIEEAIEDIRAGRTVIVVDDEDRENEGDLTIAAERVTPEIINFMATHGRGLVCLAMTPERCDELRLPLMSPHNTSNFGTAFCESIDAREGTTTGISARDRTRPVLAAIDPRLTTAGQFNRPAWPALVSRQSAGPGALGASTPSRPPGHQPGAAPSRRL